MSNFGSLVLVGFLVTVLIFIFKLRESRRMARFLKDRAIQNENTLNQCLENDEINIGQHHVLKAEINDSNFPNLLNHFKGVHSVYKSWVELYGEEDAMKMHSKEYWIGMNTQQLLAIKGTPDKMEKEMVKDKLRETYIYGAKSSGDYFVFENNVAVKIVDR